MVGQVLLRTLRKILNKRGGSAGASPAQIGEEEGSVEELSLHCLGSLEHADVRPPDPSPLNHDP